MTRIDFWYTVVLICVVIMTLALLHIAWGVL